MCFSFALILVFTIRFRHCVFLCSSIGNIECLFVYFRCSLFLVPRFKRIHHYSVNLSELSLTFLFTRQGNIYQKNEIGNKAFTSHFHLQLPLLDQDGMMMTIILLKMTDAFVCFCRIIASFCGSFSTDRYIQYIEHLPAKS